MQYIAHKEGGIVLDGREVRASDAEALAVHSGLIVAYFAAMLDVELPPRRLTLSARREREAERLCRDEGKRLSHIGSWCADALRQADWSPPPSPSQRVRGLAILARQWEKGFAGPVGQLP